MGKKRPRSPDQSPENMEDLLDMMAQVQQHGHVEAMVRDDEV